MTGEWTTIDKSGWGPGPWQDEPDKIHWIDPATDMDCLMVRHEHSGHWCGYVGVTEGHPYWSDREAVADVHGGLSFAAFCAESEDPAHGVCHVPEAGRPDHVWWLGFDCHHGRDYAPGYEKRIQTALSAVFPSTVYRDRAYVEGEVRSLARQLAAVASPAT